MAESDALHEALIDNFITVTGATRERAQFYLQASGWDFPLATSTFYEEGGEVGGMVGGVVADEGGETVPVQEMAEPVVVDKEPVHKPLPPPTQRTGFASMADYQRRKREEEEGRGKDEDESQKFFAGGSEHSGQMITGPPRKKVDAKELASDVFAAAKTHGARSIEEEEEERVREKSKAFRGTGFRLGATEESSEAVQGGPAYAEPKKVSHTLTFWSNGFSVDSGPLRNGESEEDKLFLKSVTKGEIPSELLQEARGGEVDVAIDDHRNEQYRQRAPKLLAFSGEGHKLGSMTPPLTSEHSQTMPQTTPMMGTSVDPPSVPLDPSQPTTSVQIRLSDGSRLVVKFNPTHTVNNIRQYINLSRPAMSSANYVLMTTFPSRELTDLGQTLADAKLLNAVVVQRMK